jgi:hypothetical protein
MLHGRMPTDILLTSWNTRLQQESPGTNDTMKLLVHSAMIFFGTLIAAALVALGEPAAAEVKMVMQTSPSAEMVVGLLGLGE